MGGPIDSHWRYRWTWANAQTAYYTDEEPESAIVVVDKSNEVHGYLLGCKDTEQPYKKGLDPDSIYIHDGWAKFNIVRPGTAGFVVRSTVDGIMDLVTRKQSPSALQIHDPEYPAHLHVDLLPEARGQGIGRHLVWLWLKHLQALEVPGCHLQTVVENPGAVEFFTKQGFEQVKPDLLIPGLRVVGEDGKMHRRGPRTHLRTMGQKLDPAKSIFLN